MKKISIYLMSAAALMIINLLSCNNQGSHFSFHNTDQGFGLFENNKAVFFYQRVPKTLTGEYICSNYIHPLFNLDGDALTEEFPPDHPYHRGVFWTWHQLYIDTTSLGDGWINDGISQDVIKVVTDSSKTNAEINLEVLWKSTTLGEGKPFMKEKTTIIVHPLESEIRKIDFSVELNALVDKLEIGGSNDPKGYGGFCLRLNIPDNMIFTSENKSITPQELQVTEGPWMDFSGFFGKSQQTNGVTILCNPGNPVYPSPWILRQKGSMQNAVFPGRERIKLKMGTPVILKYRIIIHKGDPKSIDLNRLQKEYKE